MSRSSSKHKRDTRSVSSQRSGSVRPKRSKKSSRKSETVNLILRQESRYDAPTDSGNESDPYQNEAPRGILKNGQ